MYKYKVSLYIMHHIIHDLFYVICSYIFYICRIVYRWGLCCRWWSSVAIGLCVWFNMDRVSYSFSNAPHRYGILAVAKILCRLWPCRAFHHYRALRKMRQKPQTHTKYCIRHQMRSQKKNHNRKTKQIRNIAAFLV